MARKVIADASSKTTCQACLGESVTRPRALCDDHKTERRRLQNRVAVRRARAGTPGRGIRAVTLPPDIALNLWDHGKQLTYLEAKLQDSLAANKPLNRAEVNELLSGLTAHRQLLLTALDAVRADIADEAALTAYGTGVQTTSGQADRRSTADAARASKPSFSMQLQQMLEVERARGGRPRH